MVENISIEVTFRWASSQLSYVYMTITVSAGEHGSISLAGSVNVEYGGRMYFYLIPGMGYEVDEILIDGEKASVSDSL